jgi:CBS domain-containing protein
MCQVKEIMTHQVVTVRPDATIDDAVSLLLDHRVSGLPVVDHDRRLLGVISELDIIDLVYHADIETTRVRDHMTRDVRTIDAEASLDDAASIFCERPIRRIPVIQAGRLVGILARRDLIRFVRDIRRQTV